MIDERKEFIKNLKITIGENLERIRKDKGKTRKELAEAINVSETTFGAYCVGRNLPPLDKIYTLAVMLDCSIIDLTGDNPRIKGREVYQYRWEHYIGILEKIGFSIEFKDRWAIIKEKMNLNITNEGVTLAPLTTRKFNKFLLTPFMDEVEEFALHNDISLKKAFYELFFGEKSALNPKNKLPSISEIEQA